MTGCFCAARGAILFRLRAVAYDEDLADRIRELLDSDLAVEEKRMFGGLAFLVGGVLAIAASGQGGVLVRADPEQSHRVVATTKAELAIMRGRPMDGWLRVAAEHVTTKRQLEKWVRLGCAAAAATAAAQPRQRRSSSTNRAATP